MKTVFFVFVALLLAGCAVPYPYYETGGAYQYQQPVPPPPAQYAPQQVAPAGCIPPYYPVWNGCALPMYGPQYIAPMYTSGLLYPVEPLFRFNFNFGHRGGGHRR